MRVHRLELGGSWEEFKRVALSVDARLPTYVSFPIEADQCVDAVIVPDDDVGLLDVEAVDGDGRVVARAREGGGARTLTVCSPTAMPGTLAIRPHVGRGLAAIVLARVRGEVARDLSARPEIAWAAAQQPLDKARHAHDTVLAKGGYTEPVATSTGTLLLGRRITVPIELKTLGGACARVDVVAGAPLGLLEASVWDDAGALLASGEASTSLALFACARNAVRLELETRGRPGPFVVTVRPERWKDAAFVAHPLAASRMLARAAAGPDMLFEGKGAPAKDVTLDASHGMSWTETVAPGRCMRVTVGVQGDGSGVDLRASNPSDGSDIDRSQSAHAAGVRACAGARCPAQREVRPSRLGRQGGRRGRCADDGEGLRSVEAHPRPPTALRPREPRQHGVRPSRVDASDAQLRAVARNDEQAALAARAGDDAGEREVEREPERDDGEARWRAATATRRARRRRRRTRRRSCPRRARAAPRRGRGAGSARSRVARRRAVRGTSTSRSRSVRPSSSMRQRTRTPPSSESVSSAGRL